VATEKAEKKRQEKAAKERLKKGSSKVGEDLEQSRASIQEDMSEFEM
jgi:hypothetical protein